MTELKTKRTTQPAEEFLKTVEPEEMKNDSFTLLKIFEEATGELPVMWGTSIVGFGMYHYRSQRSRQEGDWPLVGFSPRKHGLTLYIMAGNKDSIALFEKLGKHTASGGCLYVKRLSDVDVQVLKKLINKSYMFKDRTG